jgi:LysM repeat protein
MDMRERIAVATEVRVEESSSEINDIEPVVEDVNEVKEVADNKDVDDVTAQGVEQDAEYSAEQGKEVWHTVADGELLGRIARSYGTTISKIKQLNPDINVDRISIGQRILISDGTSPVKSPTKVEAKEESVEAKAADGDGEVWYTLQPGDLVGRVAIRYGTTAKRVQELNPDINIDRVRDGQRIRVK